jgi:restriction system protein
MMARSPKPKTDARFAKLFQPVLDALRDLGGSGRPTEVKDRIAATGVLSKEYLTAEHKSGESVFGNDVDWARFYLVRAGYLDASKRGVWALTERGRAARIDESIAAQLVRTVDATTRKFDEAQSSTEVEPESVLRSTYREETLSILRGLPPQGFEHFAQRLLRESDFEEVRVTGRSNDGGIDGDGILKVNPFVSFRVLFQCKRWSSSVGAEVVRDFRGAMAGRADKGIIITTGYFTAQAQREASRDGAPPVELVDGEELADHLARLELGLTPTKTYEVDPGFFEQFRLNSKDVPSLA